jgi:hypothetical protein
LHFLYRKNDYKPIGPKVEDFVDGHQPNAENAFKTAKNTQELKASLWEGISSRIRPKAWRTILQYTPLNSSNETAILTKKRGDYREYVLMNSEEKFFAEADNSVIETIKLIKKDVHRTLPDSHLFRNSSVQQSMVRMLLIYSVRFGNKTPIEFLLARHERHPRSDLRYFYR